MSSFGSDEAMLMVLLHFDSTASVQGTRPGNHVTALASQDKIFALSSASAFLFSTKRNFFRVYRLQLWFRV